MNSSLKELFCIIINQSMIEQAPKLQNVIPEEAENRRLERTVEVINRNHKVAIAGYDLEEYISSSDVDSIENKGIQNLLVKVPENLRPRFEHALQNYFLRKKETDVCVSEMEEIVAMNKDYSGLSQNEIEGQLPGMMYRSLLSNAHMGRPKPPSGGIKMEVKEGYIVLIFENTGDYQRAKLAQSGIIVPETERIKEDTGGTYHHSVRIDMFKDRYMGPVLMIRGDQKVGDVLAHERQHFINHSVFANFFVTENNPEKTFSTKSNMDRVIGFRRIKDEVLAYLREGRGGTEILRSLNGEIYKHLFDSLSEENKKNAREILSEIKEPLDQFASINSGDEARAIMVYQLAHISFDKFPNWLEAIRKYYYQRFELMEEFDASVSVYGLVMDKNWHYSIAHGEYPSKYAKQAEEVSKRAQELIDELKSIRDRARDIIFDQSTNISVLDEKLGTVREEYGRAQNEFSELYRPLMKGGLLAPDSGSLRSYKYGEDIHDAIKNSSENLLEVRQAVLDAVDEYPQDQIDMIADRYDGTGDKEMGNEAGKKLATYIKKIVHKFNGSRPCWIWIDKEEDHKNTFYVVVDFRAPKSENEKGVKGAEFFMNVRGSKSKF